MTDTVELKPCPFCGSKAKEVIKTQVKCSNDLCPLYYFVMHDTLWNTRPDSSLDVLKEKIEDRLNDFRDAGGCADQIHETNVVLQLISSLQSQKGKNP